MFLGGHGKRILFWKSIKIFEIEDVLNLVHTSTLFSDKATPALTQISLILDNAHPF